MRVITLVAVLLLAAVHPVLACSCSAPDGSCTASSDCGDRGCYAICGAGGCTAGCSGGGGSMLPKSRQAGPTMSYSGQGLSASALQDLISEELQVRFVFVPKKLDDQFSVQVNEVSAADLKTGLAKLGAVAVIQQREQGPQEKTASLRFSLKAENVPAGTVAQLLSQVFGDDMTVKTADPAFAVSLDLQDVTLEDLRGVLPKFSGIRVLPSEAHDRERIPVN